MPAHGIMFHHFHGNQHAPGQGGQGSISAEQFDRMLCWLGVENILPAHKWLDHALAGTLNETDLCITFDDNLRCQYDAAVAVLADHKLTAFWFVYSGVLEGRLERLEIYRQFRTTRFESVDQFYKSFFNFLSRSEWGAGVADRLTGFNPQTYLAGFPFYTDNDRQFRFVRDEVLGAARYQSAMDAMIADAGVQLTDLAANLWMDNQCLQALSTGGHVIGLHSHTHPTRMEHLDRDGQLAEYSANHQYLTKLLGQPPIAMSHPCNSYNRDTLELLKDMGIRLGFRANMATGFSSGFAAELQHPREDHANVLAAMQKNP